jgi:hypothetical protein
MASASQAIVNVQMSAAIVRLYTSATGTWTQIGKVLACNVSSSPQTLTLYIVPQSQSAAINYITTDAQALLSGQSWNSPNEYGLVLNPGDSLAGVASNGAVINLFVTGLMLT